MHLVNSKSKPNRAERLNVYRKGVMKNKIVEFKGFIMYSTEEASLVYFRSGPLSESQYWIPKSILKVKAQYVTFPEWKFLELTKQKPIGYFNDKGQENHQDSKKKVEPNPQNFQNGFDL